MTNKPGNPMNYKGVSESPVTAILEGPRARGVRGIRSNDWCHSSATLHNYIAQTRLVCNMVTYLITFLFETAGNNN